MGQTIKAWRVGRAEARRLDNMKSNHLYEIDHCTAFGPCSTRGITPTILLVCVERNIT